MTRTNNSFIPHHHVQFPAEYQHNLHDIAFIIVTRFFLYKRKVPSHNLFFFWQPSYSYISNLAFTYIYQPSFKPCNSFLLSCVWDIWGCLLIEILPHLVNLVLWDMNHAVTRNCGDLDCNLGGQNLLGLAKNDLFYSIDGHTNSISSSRSCSSTSRFSLRKFNSLSTRCLFIYPYLINFLFLFP